MLENVQRTDRFCEYYAQWILVYKKGAVREVTMGKYIMSVRLQWISTIN